MEFGLLGPVEVVDAGRTLHLGGRRQRAVLVHLLLAAGRAVPPAELVDRVWGERSPPHVRASLHTYVSRLRAELGPSRLVTLGSGYLLHAAPDEVDARRFEDRLATATAVTAYDPQAGRDGCAEALALWRGPALGDLADEPSLRAVARRLDALRETAVEQRLDARLLCGEHVQVLPELAEQVRAGPLREDRWARYVLALYRCGRSAEAVAACDRARRLLDRQLGVEPGRRLRALHEQVLRQDPGLLLHGAALHGYLLGEVLGRGPSAVVHRARQPRLERPVALKVLHPAVADDPRLVAGFAAAVRNAAAVEHPHVLPLHDAWRAPGEAVLVLHPAEGGPLAPHLLGLAGVLRLVEPLADALDACAEHGVVHARLEPGDVLLDADGGPQLSPFVLTRQLAHLGDTTGRPDVRALAGLLLELTAAWAPVALTGLLTAVARDGAETPDARSLHRQVVSAGRGPAVPSPRARLRGPARPLR